MLDFMVLGTPRSGTTWMANLLTTDTTLCMHDPLLEFKQSFLDQMVVPGKRLGISCTASLLLWPAWLKDHPARKVIIYRDINEVNAALDRLMMPPVDPTKYVKAINVLPTLRAYAWSEMFMARVAQDICKYLRVPFCPHRFYELVKMNVQPQMNRLPMNPEAVREMQQRYEEALCQK